VPQERGHFKLKSLANGLFIGVDNYGEKSLITK